jgi:hypothetical protein
MSLDCRLALLAGSPQNAAVKRSGAEYLAAIEPRNGVTVYIVVEDFGDLGQAFGAGGRRKPR